jgi:ribA/ribD-fused uncharacterized protein
MSTITTDHHVFFYSGREHYSNWHQTPHQIVLPQPVPQGPIPGFADEPVFESSEQLFMYLKARFFGDETVAGQLLVITDPRETKALGRAIRDYDERAWECVREGMMTYACWLKYSQNPAWAAELKATGNRILVEASPVDAVWGVALDVEAAARFAEKELDHGAPGSHASGPGYIRWPGRNLLGQALMKVRGML